MAACSTGGAEEAETAGAGAGGETAALPTEAECPGDVTLDNALSVVGPTEPDIRRCYETQLAAEPAFGGTLRLHTRVGRSGIVEGVAVEGDVDQVELLSCVMTVARHWQFEEPAGGECAIVIVPYIFRPES